MSARFAGSRFLDERRRRRLASESDETASAGEPPAAGASVMADSVSPAASESSGVELRLDRLVPRPIWKHCCAGIAVLLVAAGILAGGLYEAEGVSAVGPGFSRLFSLREARLLTYFCSATLLLCAELALAIWWARSLSLRDFAGRYRVWGWTAGVWFLFAFGVATDAHLALAESLPAAWQARLTGHEEVLWMLPGSVIAALLLWALQRDMCDCRGSVTIVLSAAACYAFAAIVRLCGPSAGELNDAAVLHGVVLGGHVLLLQSMLLHLRHVIHVTPEPPELRPSKVLAALRLLRRVRLPRFGLRLPRLGVRFSSLRFRLVVRLPKLRKRHPAPGGDAAVEAGERLHEGAEKPAAAKPAIEQRKQRQARGPAAQPKAAADHRTTATIDESDEFDEKAGGHSAGVDADDRFDRDFDSDDDDEEGDDDRSRLRADAGHNRKVPVGDQLELKGLSKKERRKLRKEFRDQQRTTASG